MGITRRQKLEREMVDLLSIYSDIKQVSLEIQNKEIKLCTKWRLDNAMEEIERQMNTLSLEVDKEITKSKNIKNGKFQAELEAAGLRGMPVNSI